MVYESFRQNGNSPQLFTHTALPSIKNVCRESLIMLTLGNIVLLSQLHPVWDWDQNLRATDFPSFRMVERASIYWSSGFPPILQPCLNIWAVWSWAASDFSWGKCVWAHKLFAFSWTHAVRRRVLFFPAVLDPSRAFGRQWRAEKDLGQSSVGTSVFGALTQGSWWHSGAMCFSCVRK